jgi:2-hydroxychromene-2-carboxylate isomerase
MWHDLERCCAELGVPFKRPSVFPRGSLLAARIALANEDQAWVGDFSRRVYQANFGEDRDIGSPEVIAEILIDLKLDPRSLRAQPSRRRPSRRCANRTELAISLGIFGAPTWRVGEELFWGSDRVDQAVRFWQRQRS